MNDMSEPVFAAAEQLERAFLRLAPGDTLRYHVGFLTVDRSEILDTHDQEAPEAPVFLTEAARILNEIADYAMRLEQEGRAELFQVRRRRGEYEYFLAKRHEVDEDGRCHWEKFAANSRVPTQDRRKAKLALFQKGLGRAHFEQRLAFFRRNRHLEPINQPVFDPCQDGFKEAV